MKKLFPLILLMTLLTMPFAAQGETDEHFDYTISYIGASGAEEDDLYHYFCDMFNLDIEMVSYSWADYAQAASIMINGGTMMDMMTVDTGFEMIANWAAQGLIRALPNNWKEAYPNIYAYMDNAGLVDLLTQPDGKVYCVPKAIYSHFTAGDTYLWHYTLFYRADWAEELGFTIGDTITIFELNEFVKACQEKDLSSTGNTLGLTLRPSLISELMRLSSPYYNTFAKVDGSYVWGPTMDGTVEAITRIKQMYNQGILDPDFYLYGNGAEVSAFTSGQAACMLYDGFVGSYSGIIDNVVSTGVAASIDDAYDKVNVTVLVNDEGVWMGSETANYCWANVFSNDMTEAEFTRLLSLLDYLYTKEAELAYNLGIQDVSWFEAEDGYKLIYYNENGDMATADFEKNLWALTRNDDGSYTIGEQVGTLTDENCPYEAKDYPSKVFWFRQAILGDDFMLADPAANPINIERITRCYQTRSENAATNGYRPLDFDYMFFNSQAKNEYSVDIDSEVLRIVADATIPESEVESTWNSFIETYRNIWEPVVNDLNAAFAQ